MEKQRSIEDIKKVRGNRVHKVTHSWGVYDAFKYYRKNKPNKKEFILKEVQYFAIVRRMNELLRDSFVKGNDIIFPCRMGRLEARKVESIYRKENGVVKTNLPIDWDATLKLWCEDEEAYNNKMLIRFNIPEIFRIHYDRSKANYQNKSLYQFSPNRELKILLKKSIKNGSFDAFKQY